MAVLAAYIQRLRTGRGQKVEVSMQESIVNLSRVMLLVSTLATNRPAPRTGNRSGGVGVGDLYKCAPGGANDYAFIYALDEATWCRLCKTIGRPELVEDPRFANPVERARHTDEIDAIVTQWTSARSKHEVMTILGEAGIPCGKLLDSVEILNDPHLIERGMIREIDHPTRGRMKMAVCAMQLEDSPVNVIPAPLLGQHNAEVYATMLGFGEQQLQELRLMGVI